ncbi:PREDICTED: WAT1-related protein At5g40230-like [Ipomoea nil]|uniref:WAT1-related protein At5g40230-like n=1 Tax=Ipomoea nil TaxID=35883 RepID=UPI00090150F5|nr:PREDICTED: WAT1-related protein At5g40230-like [Ipomoea nil]
MGMESAIPFLAMVVTKLAQVGLMVAAEAAMATGMTAFTFITYSNLLACLILIPSSLLMNRSSHPPLLPTFVCGFFLLGLIGFFIQSIGYMGLQYSSPLLASSLLNLSPGFTFILAIILRMENFKCGSFTTLAKLVGTVVSIIGALIATLYKGPPIVTAPFQSSTLILNNVLNQSSTWVLGGFLMTIDTMIASIFIIAQAFVLKKYPAELILMLFYSCCVAILCAAVALIIERDLSAWSLSNRTRLFAILYSGFFGNVFQVTICSWCVRRKGPVFVGMFEPLGVVISMVIGVLFLGETFYLGSLVGSIIVVVGFYFVIWGKARDGKMIERNGVDNGSESATKNIPLLQDNDDDVENNRETTSVQSL